MNENVAHLYYVIPGDFIMRFFEGKRQHVGCFSDYFYILYDGEITQLIISQFFQRKPLGKRCNMICGFNNICKTTVVSFRFSHILKFYHD